jgi:hypothetical protein
VYINPTAKRGYDAAAVRERVAKEWPFKMVAYPGRDIDGQTWQSIPDEKR